MPNKIKYDREQRRQCHDLYWHRRIPAFKRGHQKYLKGMFMLKEIESMTGVKKSSIIKIAKGLG